MQCEVCRSVHVAPWVTVSDYVHYRCDACGHLYVYPRPPAQDVEECYRNASFYDKAESEEARLTAEARVRVRTLTALADAQGLGRRLLDVGCASGIFLEQAREAGWEVEGVEVSAVLSARARKKGFAVTNDWLEHLPDTYTYPVVTAWEVLEHAIDPVAFLQHLRSRVIPGGLLALSTPLADGLPAKMLRSRFPMICPPEHLSLFSRKSIRILGASMGLEMIRFRSFSNLKRENLARGLCRFVFGAAFLPGSLAVRLSSVLAAALVPLPAMMDAMGAGSEMEVIFRSMP